MGEERACNECREFTLAATGVLETFECYLTAKDAGGTVCPNL